MPGKLRGAVNGTYVCGLVFLLETCGSGHEQGYIKTTLCCNYAMQPQLWVHFYFLTRDPLDVLLSLIEVQHVDLLGWL